MIIMIVGLGSMGRRRIRLLKKYSSEFKLIGVDSNEERCRNVENEYQIKGYLTIEEACRCEKPTVAFVCTSPLSHANIIRLCLEENMHVFSELNLVSTLYEDNIFKANENNKTLFLSSTFLYRKEIEYIGEQVHCSEERVNYVYHVGQYLPDWHPWENYKDFFVGEKETNGCREFMAIEFPWIMHVFGKIKGFYKVYDTMSRLEVNYPDNYLIMFEHENGNKGLIALDVVSRRAVRNLEIFGENLYITWDGTPEGLVQRTLNDKQDNKVLLYNEIDKRKEYCASIIEDAYYEEICNFFEVISQEGQARYSFEKDKEVLEIINQIEDWSGKNEQE